jgi:diguanylate cyclase (GGDEF)-like protein
MPSMRGLAPLLAGLSFGAALTMTADGVPHVVRLALAAAAALVIALTASALQTRSIADRRRSEPRPRTDSLTGLYDRAGFDESLAHEVERARSADRPLALLIADLDGLRAHEEWFGVDARNRAVRLVAKDLEKRKRRIDVAAHVGGGEFALLLPGTTAGGAMLVAERMRRAAHRSFAGERSRPTLSLGVAVFPDHATDADGLLDAARRALAAAKQLGRDRSALFNEQVESVLAPSESEAGSRELLLVSAIALAQSLDLRDPSTAAHSRSVALCAELTALELGLPEARRERLALAGMLHDVGMIGVPAELIAQSGPLDEAAWAQVREHPLTAARLLPGPELADLRSWIAAHHERPDGKGYPRGLAGDEIPLEGRILAVADAWEAMTAERPYRPALDEDAARAELRAGVGTQFDGAVVDALLSGLDRERSLRT